MVQRSNPSPPGHGHGSAIVLSPSPPVVWGVWYCPPPPPVVWWGCGTVPIPPLWRGGGVVLTVWMVGMVCKSVGYGMFDMTVCMVCTVCMVTKLWVWNVCYAR